MKQEAHKKLINAKSGTADAARLAQKVRFDEFYTPQDDIKNELNHYKAKFYGKRIICPCDWDVLKDEDVYSVTIEFAEEPITPTYILNRVNVVKVKHFEYALNLIDEINVPKPVIKEEIVSGDKARELLKTRVTCNFVKYLLGIANECKIKSITASGYDGINKRGIKFQDIDYSQYDLCLTNPPFSLYTEFMNCMMTEYEKRDRATNPFDFIVLAPLLNRLAPNVGVPLFERKVFLGYNRDTHILFRNPDEHATHDKKKSVDIDWITTFDDAQKEVDKYLISTGIKYDQYKDEYVELTSMTMKDGTHPIRINDKRAIPEDYIGWMFCSIGVLNKLSYKYYEWYGSQYTKYFNTTHPELNPLAHKITPDIFNGAFKGGLFVRRRPDVPYEEPEIS